MAILYALVARDTTVLAEFSSAAGNAGDIARRILESLQARLASRLCFAKDRHVFCVLTSEAVTFVCMATDTFGRRVPFIYLEDIRKRFMKKYRKVAHSALAYEMNDEFSRVLHRQMEFYSSNPDADTLNRLQGEVSEIHSMMVANIDTILDRGDRLSLLVDKTTSILQDKSFHFRKQARRVRESFWMKNTKLIVVLGCTIVLILYLIVAACCGGITLPSCR